MRLTVAAKLQGTSKEPATIPILLLGPLGHVTLRGVRATASLESISDFCFRAFVFCSIRFSKERGMRRVDLFQATMQGWGQLSPVERERFFRAGLKAALRLNPLQFRAWLLRRLRNQPPDDPAAFAISDDMVALLKQLPLGTSADPYDVG